MKTKRMVGDLSWMDPVALVAACMVVTPFASLLFATFPRANAAIRVLATLLFFAVGWGIQALVCRLLRYTRPREGNGYEKKHKYYHIGLAIPAWIAAVVIFLFISRAADAFLYYIGTHTTEYLYDEFSVFPSTAGAVAAVLVLLGSAVRLYPYTRVLAMRACMTYVALFLIAFMLDGGRVSGFCLFVFAICAALLLNQISLERELTTLTLSELPRETRAGGVSAVLWLGLIFLGVCAVLTVIVGGGMMVGRMLLFMLLSGLFSDDNTAENIYQTQSSEEILGVLENYLVQGDESPWLNYLLMVLFLLGIVALILFFALRHNSTVRRWLRQLWDRITAFVDWLFGASTRIYYRASDEQDIGMSYREVRRKLKQGEIEIGEAAVGMGWREFQRQLAAQPNDTEKMTYAYAVLAAKLRGQPAFPLLRSDTPRVIDRKVRARGRHADLREITAVYETIRYAERAPDPAELDHALAMTCNILREYFN